MILGGFEPHKSNGGGGHLLQFPSTNIVQVMSNPESLLSDLLMVMKIRRRRQGIQRGPKSLLGGGCLDILVRIVVLTLIKPSFSDIHF